MPASRQQAWGATPILALLSLLAAVGLVYLGDDVASLLRPYNASLDALGLRGIGHALAAASTLTPTRSQAAESSPNPTGSHVAATTDLQQPAARSACGIDGKVSGCGCDFVSTETMVHDELQPLLSKLVHMPFFRYFKVNLYCDCEFWPDAGMCFSRDCCVEACEDSEVPEPWRKEQQQHRQEQQQQLLEQQQQQQHVCSDPISPVDRSVDEGVAAKLSSVTNWSGLNNPWVPEGDQDVEYVYVNLQLNPERYTGYKGEDARRIWAAIYAQSAFEGMQAPPGPEGPGASAEGQGLESRVLYRLISGMHSSITASIIQNFFNETSGTWGPNLPFFKARFTGAAARPYIENLYFTCLFLLRAVMKAGPVLDSLDYNTGTPEEKATTLALVQHLHRSPTLLASCPEPFNEGLLWQARDPAEKQKLEQQLQVAFHNITKLMDCVGCEKCKLWGKLQVLGIATSLKILFSQQQAEPGAPPPPPLQLHRNEVIALVNLLARVADSVETVRQLSLELKLEEAQE